MVDQRVTMALFVFCGMLASPSDAAICRVTTNGSPAGDGSDWGAQARELNSALGDAACTEIWVESGVYKPIVAANSSAVTRAEREISFTIDRPMLLYGGFNGTETAREQRNPSVNLTVLSGDIDGNDIVDGSGVIGRVADIVGANSFHVLWVNGTTENGAIDQATWIDGFVITAGFADDTHPWNAGGRGGGLYCNGEGGQCSPTLTNVRFIGNYAYYSGGALYNRGVNGVSSPVLDLVHFIANEAEQIGGAIHNHAQDGISSPQLGAVSFTDNHAGASGGAIYNLGIYGISSPGIFQVTFDGNSAMGEGGAMTSHGLVGRSEPRLTNVTFYANSATDGGALFNHARSDGIGSPLLRNVTFNGNEADNNGGAIYNEGLGDGVSEMSLINVILWGNGALNLGAEMFNNNASPRIRDSIVASGCPLESDCSGGGIIDADPVLGPLQDNGGATHTMLPGTEGSAFDTGDNVNCPSDDQRGLLRPQGEACDIGSVEFLVAVSVSVSVSGMGTVSAEGFPSPVSGAILNCRAGGGANCSADYPGLSELPLLLEPSGGWAIGSVNGCDGSLAGSVYTTSPVAGNCSVVIEFVLVPEIFSDRFETP
jgi:predicted outer membrane repeat protein